jgi:hypothetical protein
MGKASRNLNKSVKKCHADLEAEFETYDSDFLDDNDEYSIEDYIEKIQEVSCEIKSALLSCSRESGYPICEYLDTDDIEKYLFSLLKSNF